MKTIKEHVNILIKYWRNYYTDGGFPDIFSLKKEMIEHNICPRCGVQSHVRRSDISLQCYEDNCKLKITSKEWEMIYEDKKGILKKILRK